MSWDSSREIKPLYLPEKVSSTTNPAGSDAREYPELPPSEPPSRESPGPEFEEREGDVDYMSVALGVAAAAGLLQSLQIDTSGAAAGAREMKFGEMLQSGSGETTPRALVAPAFGGSPVVRDVEDFGEWELVERLEALPPLPESRPESPVPVAESPVLAQRALDVELERLPALPDSRPESPTVQEPLVISAQPSAGEDLENLPALPESEPGSPLLTALHPVLPADDELEQLPGLPESLPASPILASPSPAFTPLPLGDELEHLPALPESPPSSPTREPLSAITIELLVDTDLETLPALPESRASSPALEPLSPVTRQQLVGEDLENLPALPESRPDSPVLGMFSPFL
jgi:hypothetical protein